MPQRPNREPLTTYLRVEKRHVSAIAKTLQDTSKSLEKDLLKVSGDNITDVVTRAQIKAQRAAIDQHLQGLWTNVDKSIHAGMEDSAVAASNLIFKQMDGLFARALPVATRKAIAEAEAFRAAAGVQSVMARHLNSYIPLAKSVYNAERLSSGWVDKTVNRALASGWSAKQLAKEVAKSIRPDVPGGVSYASIRLARTEINNAFHATTISKYLELGFIEGVDWNTSGSHPEEDECDEYKARSPWHPKQVPDKPHPQCLCYITPTLPDPDEFVNNLLSGKYGENSTIAAVQAAEKSAPLSKVDPRRIDKVPEVQQYAKENLLDVRSLSDAQRRELQYYTGAGSSRVNRELREGKLSVGTKETAKAIDAAMKKSVLPEDVILTRMSDGLPFQKLLGKGADPDNLQPLLGKVFKDKAYLSTSLGTTPARGFAKSFVKMEITAPKGTKGLYLETITSVKGERELLLPRNTSILIESIEKKGGQWRIAARIVSS